MALPDLSTLCVELQVSPGEICISFPGGATICAQAGYKFGDPTEIIESLFGQLNSALAPLAPFFNLLDVVLKIVACVQAIPDALGPPPDPQGIINCIPDLMKAFDKVLKLIPALSIPAMIKDLINAIITFLVGLKLTLQAMINKTLQIIASRLRAETLGLLDLDIALDCAQANLDAQLANMNQGIAPLNHLLGIISAFMQIAGLGCLPGFGNIGDLAGDVLTPIDILIEILQAIRDAIPDLPILELGAGQAPC